ncbi:hypothetical protein RNZ50_00735 [Paracoccaceae bacterium Fryx2]|nr:hypothetical protein [Paracoccaceae bacterium Fryx2]
MRKRTLYAKDPGDDDLSRPGPYDPEPDADDPWFEPEPQDIPLPRADRRPLIEPRAWAAAQADLAAELAAVAVLFGALDERLRAGPDGWRHRLALLEAAELSWWAGDRVPLDRLALWEGLRLANALDDSQALTRAAWALRRLAGGPGPEAGMAAFLGRHGPQGAVPDGLEDLDELATGLDHLHPVTRSAALFHGWRMQGQGGPARDIEAAVLAARVAARMGRGGAVFVPLAHAGFAGGRGGGAVLDKLALWLGGAERSVLAALLHLDRVADWAGRAGVALADLQGRTPALLVTQFAAWPMVSAPLAEQATGAGRATVQRNLTLMQGRGLIREVTGQGRYRVWTAKL